MHCLHKSMRPVRKRLVAAALRFYVYCSTQHGSTQQSFIACKSYKKVCLLHCTAEHFEVHLFTCPCLLYTDVFLNAVGFVGGCIQSARSTFQMNVCELIIVSLQVLITSHSLCLHTFFPLVYLTGENPTPALHCTTSQLLMPMCHVCVYVCAYGIAMRFTFFGLKLGRHTHQLWNA